MLIVYLPTASALAAWLSFCFLMIINLPTTLVTLYLLFLLFNFLLLPFQTCIRLHVLLIGRTYHAHIVASSTVALRCRGKNDLCIKNQTSSLVCSNNHGCCQLCSQSDSGTEVKGLTILMHRRPVMDPDYAVINRHFRLCQ